MRFWRNLRAETGLAERCIAKFLPNRTGAMADNRRSLDKEHGFSQKFEVQSCRAERVAFAIIAKLDERIVDALPHIRRSEPEGTTEQDADQAGAHRPTPPELPPTEQQQQNRRDHEAGPAAEDKENVS